MKKGPLTIDSPNTEAEILNVLIKDNHMSALFIKDMDPEFFSTPRHRIIMRAIKTYFTKYGGVPTETALNDIIAKVVEKKQGKNLVVPADISNTIAKVYTETDYKKHQIKYYEEEIEKFIKMNKMRQAFLNNVDHMDDITKFNDIENEFKTAALWTPDKNIGVEIMQVEERYERINQVFENFVPLPFKHMSKAIGGGMLPKSLTYIAAQSGLGKSILLDQIAFYCWKELGMNVVIASCELSEEVKSLRIDSQFVNRETKELVKDNKVAIDAYKAIGPKDNYLFIKEFPASATNSRMISGYIHRLKSFYDMNVGLIVVDYADIVIPNSNKKNSLYETGGDVAEELRYLGYEWECPVISATQINRQGTDISAEELSRIHISESHKKFNTCDSIIGLAALPSERAQGLLYAKILKARHGIENIIIPMSVQYEYLKMAELGHIKMPGHEDE